MALYIQNDERKKLPAKNTLPGKVAIQNWKRDKEFPRPSSWPGNFHMLWSWPKKKKKRDVKCDIKNIKYSLGRGLKMLSFKVGSNLSSYEFKIVHKTVTDIRRYM